MTFCLVVSSNADKRSLLTKLIERAELFDEVGAARDFAEAGNLLLAQGRVDAVFIHRLYDDVETAGFIAELKASKKGRNARFILVIREQEASKNALADSMLAGVHSFVKEPLTLEGVISAAALSQQVKTVGSSARLKAAAGLIFSNVLNEMKEPGAEPPPPDRGLWEEVKHACGEFKRITGESMTHAVVKPIQDVSEELPEYTGVSERVRRTYEKKLRLLRQRLLWFIKK